MRVIDVSNHQPDFDPKRSVADAYWFKASQGMRTPDRLFEKHMANAIAAGYRDIAAYHFMDPTNRPEDDAALFISKVKPFFDHLDFLVADWEPDNGDNGNVDWCVRFIRCVRDQSPIPIHIYMNLGVADEYKWQPVRDLGCKLIVAAYGANNSTGWDDGRTFPTPSGWDGKVMGHQYTDQGFINGYGPIDLSNFREWPKAVGVPSAEVGGAIGDKWRALGGASGPLGNVVDKVEMDCDKLGGKYRTFEHGSIVWSLETGAHTSWGEVRKKWAEYGYETGRLGYPTSDENPVNGGTYQTYQGGSIYWSPDTGAHVVWGEIGRCWGENQWEWGRFGWPVTDEFDGIKQPGKAQRFQHGTIYWSPSGGAWGVGGGIMAKYAQAGYEGGRYGYPTDVEVSFPTYWVQRFEGGYIDFPNVGSILAQPRGVVIPEIHENDPSVQVDMKGGSGRNCVCVKIVWPIIEQELIKRGLIRECVDWFQMGYNTGGVAASAGTHDMGGVGDIGQWTLDQRKVMCEFGVMPFPRISQFGWNTGNHCHFGMHGCNHRAPYLAQQVRDGMNGYNGLVSNIRIGFEAPTRTWQQALRDKGLAA